MMLLMKMQTQLQAHLMVNLMFPLFDWLLNALYHASNGVNAFFSAFPGLAAQYRSRSQTCQISVMQRQCPISVTFSACSPQHESRPSL